MGSSRRPTSSDTSSSIHPAGFKDRWNVKAGLQLEQANGRHGQLEISPSYPDQLHAILELRYPIIFLKSEARFLCKCNRQKGWKFGPQIALSSPTSSGIGREHGVWAGPEGSGTRLQHAVHATLAAAVYPIRWLDVFVVVVARDLFNSVCLEKFVERNQVGDLSL